MGLHQDRDEADFSAPICLCRSAPIVVSELGGTRRADKVFSLVLSSGDALLVSGAARLRYHGVDKILPSLAAALADAAREPRRENQISRCGA